jgi:hypothetical protein
VAQKFHWWKLPKAANFNLALFTAFFTYLNHIKRRGLAMLNTYSVVYLPENSCKMKFMRFIYRYKFGLISCISCFVIITMLIPLRGWALTPTPVYQSYSIQGFTVLINQELIQHKYQANEALKELNLQLGKIRGVIPEKAWQSLQKVKIWVEFQQNKNSAAAFHISADWLQQHGYYTEKAGSIEISNAQNFITWSRTQQPWMMLHELSHAYHFLFLGESYSGIMDAYQQALNYHLYESVDYISGGKMRAYALTNSKEYFAELSEAYFGKNDFYPFTRQQLAEYDPVGFRLMQQAWENNGALEIPPSLEDV